MHYYKFNIADWTLHTAHLTAEEEGVYFRLVNYYYDTESPIPEKTHTVIRRLRLDNNSETVGVILEEFFYLEGGFWHHKRCESEITAYHAKTDTNRANGKRGGRPRGSKDSKPRAKKPTKTQSVSSGNPNKTLTINHKPITINQLKDMADGVISHLNDKAGKRFRTTDTNRDFVIARLKDGFTDGECKQVIDNRCMRWLGTDREEYLRPSTLFGKQKFEGYLNDNGPQQQRGADKAPQSGSTRDRPIEQDLRDVSWAL